MDQVLSMKQVVNRIRKFESLYKRYDHLRWVVPVKIYNCCDMCGFTSFVTEESIKWVKNQNDHKQKTRRLRMP